MENTPEKVPSKMPEKQPQESAHFRAYLKYKNSPKGKAARLRAQAKYKASLGYLVVKDHAKAKRDGRRVEDMFASEEEFKAYRLSHGLPWPVPADEYAKQIARELHPSRRLAPWIFTPRPKDL